MNVEEQRIERTIKLSAEEFVQLVNTGEVGNDDLTVRIGNKDLAIMRLAEYIDTCGVEALF